jgi:hypothetical protein
VRCAQNDTEFPQSLPYEIAFYKLPWKIGDRQEVLPAPYFMGLRVNKGFRSLISEVAGVLAAFFEQDELSSADLGVICGILKLLKEVSVFS